MGGVAWVMRGFPRGMRHACAPMVPCHRGAVPTARDAWMVAGEHTAAQMPSRTSGATGDVRRSDLAHYLISVKRPQSGGAHPSHASRGTPDGEEEEVMLQRVDYQLPKGSVAADSYSHYVSSLTFSSHWLVPCMHAVCARRV